MGDIAPVWPNHPSTKVIITGGEQGDPVGHLASYTNLTLQNKALYNQAVTIGHNNHYGKTYLERAKTYATQAIISNIGETGYTQGETIPVAALVICCFPLQSGYYLELFCYLNLNQHPFYLVGHPQIRKLKCFSELPQSPYP